MKYPLYKCDEKKNTKCRKLHCHIKGGPCKATSCPEFAVLDLEGKPVEIRLEDGTRVEVTR